MDHASIDSPSCVLFCFILRHPMLVMSWAHQRRSRSGCRSLSQTFCSIVIADEVAAACADWIPPFRTRRHLALWFAGWRSRYRC